MASDVESKLRSVQVGDTVHYLDEGKSALGVVTGWRGLPHGRHMVLIYQRRNGIPLESIIARVRERGEGKGEVVFK